MRRFIASRNWLLLSFSAGLLTALWDVSTTLYAFRKGNTEGNPFFYIVGFQLFPVAAIAQASLSMIVAYGTIQINRRHTTGPLTWKNTVIAFNFPRILVGIMNILF
jgi:hypothetical protein